MEVNKNRKSNFELMRIISMFMIVIWHIIVYGRLRELINSYKFVVDFVEVLLVVHVNSFILLMGYFQYDKQISIKKIIHLFNASWFYRTIIVLLFLIFGLVTLTPVDILQYISPIDMKRNYWFITAYLILYILSPFVNILVANMNQKCHRKLLIVLTVLFSVIPFFTNQTAIANDGYTNIQFIYMYLIGAYFGRYKVEKNIHIKNYSVRKRRFIFVFMYFFLAIFNLSINYLSFDMYKLNNSLLSFLGNIIACRKLDYSNPIVVFQSIFYFLYFESLSLSNKFINKISSFCLGIYLITEHLLIQNIFYSLFKIDINHFNNSPSFFIRVFLVSIVIFIFGVVIECIRQNIVKFICNREWFKKISNKFYKLLNEF